MGDAVKLIPPELYPIAGFVLFFLIFYLNYKAIQELKDSFRQLGRRLEGFEENLMKFKVEVAERYLRRDEWLAFHNKMEASLKTEIRELKEVIRELFGKTG